MQGSVSSLIRATGRRMIRALRPARSAARIARSGVRRPWSSGRPALRASAEVGRSSSWLRATRHISSGSSTLAALAVMLQPGAAAAAPPPPAASAGTALSGVSSGDCSACPPGGWSPAAAPGGAAAGRAAPWRSGLAEGASAPRPFGPRRIGCAISVRSPTARPVMDHHQLSSRLTDLLQSEPRAPRPIAFLLRRPQHTGSFPPPTGDAWASISAAAGSPARRPGGAPRPKQLTPS